MNYGLILAGGVGQRMRSTGTPKQFLEVFNKPIIIYTLEQFERCEEIDHIVVVCNTGWIDYLNNLLIKFEIKKVLCVVAGGQSRQKSVEKGFSSIQDLGAQENDIVVVHDAVRPMVSENVIRENIRMAKQKGCAMTVSPVQETVVVTNKGSAGFGNIMKRDDTYTLTSPQTFQYAVLKEAIYESNHQAVTIPLLDAAMAYASLNHEVYLVKDSNRNIKITTPEDYYVFKALIELEESRSGFGL